MRNIFLSITFIVPFIANLSCSDSKFAGGSPGIKKPKKEMPTKNSDLNSDPGGPNTVTIDDMGKIEDCPKGAMVQDPNATFTFGPGEGKLFINSLGNITPIPLTAWNAGSIHADKESVDAVCRLKGYVASESFTTGKYSSCGDNTHGYWNEAIKNFEIKGACVNNLSAKIIVCRGLLKDICAQDKSWIFQPNLPQQNVNGQATPLNTSN